MSNLVIKVEHVSKLYRLGEIGTGMISHDIKRWWAMKRGKEDPFAVIGTENNRAVKSDSKYSWALKDIDFEVHQGDVLGIIGKNGAGKSTLLKILSRITTPTEGAIKVKGRIASLLEVGTGFHPELTGRENIYLNGAILGMTKKEINRKFDDIVEFSGVARYIDTPVKRYSSGMTVRLGFAVAAYLESEILVVDEVLAVGDAEFQKKAIGKMKDVSSDGRTVLFVSHNMPSMKALCNKGLLLKNGTVDFSSDINKTIDRYLTADSDMSLSGIIPDDMERQYGTDEARFRKVILKDEKGELKNEFYYRSNIVVEVHLDVLKDIPDGVIAIMIGTLDGERITYQDSLQNNVESLSLRSGTFIAKTTIRQQLLPGAYSIYLGVNHIGGKTIEWIERAYDFYVSNIAYEANEHYRWDKSHGYVLNDSPIEINKI
jgi:lipopolysaccharide transport system ATP-binding protein